MDEEIKMSFEEFEKLADMINMSCECCGHCMYLESGDYVCTYKDEPILVYDNFEPTEDYMWCDGDYYIER